MPEETRRFYATDKEIYDVLASSKQRMTDAALLDMGNKRGIFYSPHESRDALASNLSMLPFDYDSLAAVLGQSENPNRAEKVTSITLKTDIGTEAIKAAVNKFRDTAPSDEKVTSHAESASKYVMQVRYSELDLSKTRLLQRRTREANIRFVVENNALTIRMPATPKARSIAAAIKNELDAAAKSDIPAAAIEISDLSWENRTVFFTRLISEMTGYVLNNVTSVKVQSSEKPSVAAVDDTDQESDEEKDEAEDTDAESMAAAVENAALHGTSILGSAEYQLLRKKGFFITFIAWTAKQTDSPYNMVEFDAGFEEAKEGKAFRYNVRGLYRNNEGRYTKTLLSLSSQHKDEIFPIIEQTAHKVLDDLRNPASSPATSNGGETT